MATSGHGVAHDAARPAALNDDAILDTPSEVGFDDIVRLAARACDAPTARVSLVTDDRQWFKARSGLPNWRPISQRRFVRTPKREDIYSLSPPWRWTRGPRNRLVTGAPYARFYAGAPLRVADGQVLGALYGIDLAARPDRPDLEQAERCGRWRGRS